MQAADAGRAGSGAPRPRWYSGALHIHTHHSDGAIDPAALSDAARSAGVDFMVITDHNNTTHTREPLPASPLQIIGEEVTTPAGHASVWGLRPGAWFDFRVGPPDQARARPLGEARGRPVDAGAGDTIKGMIAEAHRTGALFSIDHPVDNCAGCSWDQPVPDGVDAVEIWQNEKAPRDAEVAFWDRLLRAGRHVTAVGVSDWHRPPARIDMAAVRVLADSLTEQAVLEGLRRGRVIVMRDSETAPPSVTASCGSHTGGIGDTLVCSVGDVLKMTTEADAFRKGRVDFIWNAARMTSRNLGHGATFSMPAGNGYLRAHLYDAADRPVAITNPVYVEIR